MRGDRTVLGSMRSSVVFAASLALFSRFGVSLADSLDPRDPDIRPFWFEGC